MKLVSHPFVAVAPDVPVRITPIACRDLCGAGVDDQPRQRGQSVASESRVQSLPRRLSEVVHETKVETNPENIKGIISVC